MNISLSKITITALKTLGKLIRAARINRKLSQHSLAERLNVSRYSVMAIEEGDPKVSIGVVFEAALIVGVPLIVEDKEDLQKLGNTLTSYNALLPQRVRHKEEPNDDNF